MPIDSERLWARLEALAEMTEQDRPWTRRSFTPMFLKGRAYVEAEFRAAGLAVRMDAGGNLIGRLEGREQGLAPILIGSHSDTVPAGGRFDGPLGIFAALGVAERLIADGERLRHPLEVVDFLAEEPSEFGLSCIGSRAIAGALTPADLARTRPDGMTLAEAIAYAGGRPDALAEARRPSGSIAAFCEVHIEQGRILENEGLPIGIVTDIAGIRREKITITGRTDHAGATPMALRADALVGAARIVAATYARALALSQAGPPLVATIGAVTVEPNAANAVPGRVVLVLEVRAGDDARVKAFPAAVMAEVAPDLAALGVTAAMEPISHVAPTPCADVVRTAIRDGAAAVGLATRDLFSGAGHDAVFVSAAGPVGMIFTPCREGRSHAPEEWLEPNQAADGARALYETVRLLDARLD